MITKLRLAACVAMAGVIVSSSVVAADDHVYTEGPVVNVAMIRTVDGRFDDYMKWLSTTWKAQQEAAKKAGYIVSYQVLAAEPHTPDEADVVLVITYKNWAALDGALAKGDEITKLVEGSVAAANEAQVDRAKIRRVLGSQTMQVMELK